MDDSGLLSLSAVELGRAIKEKKTTAAAAMAAVLSQIERSEKEYHCYVTIDREGALKRAEEVQERIDSGELTGALAGVYTLIYSTFLSTNSFSGTRTIL